MPSNTHTAGDRAHRAVAAGLHPGDHRLSCNRPVHNLNQHGRPVSLKACLRERSELFAVRAVPSAARFSPYAKHPPLTGGSSATSSPSRSTAPCELYSRFTATARLRQSRSSSLPSARLPIAELDVRPRKSPSSSPTLPSPGNSTCSPATSNRSLSTPKYSTLTRTRPEYPQAHRRAYAFRCAAQSDSAKIPRLGLTSLLAIDTLARPHSIPSAPPHT